jgi:hypothetical protein
LVFAIEAATRQSWVGVSILGTFFVLSTLTIGWRIRSGIQSWPLSATVVALLTGIRPTREGLTRKDATRPHRPSGNGRAGQT